MAQAEVAVMTRQNDKFPEVELLANGATDRDPTDGFSTIHLIRCSLNYPTASIVAALHPTDEVNELTLLSLRPACARDLVRPE